MSGCLNRVEIIGNLGQSPEVRTTQKGARIVTFSVATNETWKNEAGARQERTDWHRVVIFSEKLGELAEKFLKKGSKVFVSGALRSRKWQDKEGKDYDSIEIHITPFEGTLLFLDRKSDENSSTAPSEDTRAAA
jgi:single-strand DNA-binding protein